MVLQKITLTHPARPSAKPTPAALHMGQLRHELLLLLLLHVLSIALVGQCKYRGIRRVQIAADAADVSATTDPTAA